jgi:eukaryotic-like serine/threonine-protein kinase
MPIERDPDDPGLGHAETEASDRSSETATDSETASAGGAAAPAPAPEPRGFRTIEPGAVLERYVIEAELGEGGMATVYRARDQQLRRDVAVKVLFPHLARKREVVQRFSREARAAAGLEHPHILRVYDVGGGETPGGDPPYIVMELVRGESLREVCEQGALGAELVASIGAVLCDALAVAHGAGIVHRDVKPANVLVASGGRLLLADFGVARIDDDDSVVTRTGALLGTPSFMSPEQAQGQKVDVRSDLYSVGASLYQLVTGALPFSGPTARVVAQIVRGELTPAGRRAPAIGPDLARAIERLMAVDPDKRPASAAETAALLREVAAAGGGDDVEDELARFFADRAAYRAARPRETAMVVVERARAALGRRELARAIALADRAVALAPDDADVRALAAAVARGGRRRRWAALAAGVLALGGGGAAVALWPAGQRAVAGHDGGASDDVGIPDAVAGGSIDAAAIVVDAPLPVVVPDGLLGSNDASAAMDAAIGRAPLVDAAPAAPPRPRADAAPRPPPTTDATVTPLADAALPGPGPDLPAPPAPPAPARLTVVMDAWCDVTIDGVAQGRADRHRPIAVAPGHHEVACSQGPGLASWRGGVDVVAGEDRAVEGSLLAKVAVTVDIAGEVRIDGAPHGRGDVVPLSPGRHKIEVIGGGEAAERWVTIARGTPCRLRDTPELDCYP